LIEEAMMIKIDILIPTRNRYDRLIELLDSLEKTISKKNIINVHLYIDNDDEALIRNLYRLYNFCVFVEFNLVAHIGDKTTNLSQKWNYLAEIGKGNILMHAGDDIVFTTRDWDKMVVDAFEESGDKLLLVYGDDGIQGEKLATHGFVSRKHVEIFGRLFPPIFEANYNDTYLTYIYKEADRLKFLPGMKIEHKHFSKYPELMDGTYTRAIKKYDEAKKRWEESKDQREHDAHVLRNMIAVRKDYEESKKRNNI
jgi:glycosyltransferase involved in cell wall biosynthesis